MAGELRTTVAGGRKPTAKTRAKGSIQVTKRHSLYLKPEDEDAVLDRAVEVIGDKSEAMRWLGVPVRALDYATPISLLHTRKGRKAVMATLSKLEHGVL